VPHSCHGAKFGPYQVRPVRAERTTALASPRFARPDQARCIDGGVEFNQHVAGLHDLPVLHVDGDYGLDSRRLRTREAAWCADRLVRSGATRFSRGFQATRSTESRTIARVSEVQIPGTGVN